MTWDSLALICRANLGYNLISCSCAADFLSYLLPRFYTYLRPHFSTCVFEMPCSPFPGPILIKVLDSNYTKLSPERAD